MQTTRKPAFWAISFFMLIAGCVAVDQPYGKVGFKMYRDQITIDTILPENAPSIFQHFRRFPEGFKRSDAREEHLGIDIVAAQETAVIAPAGGRVFKTSFDPFYGNTVEVDHGTGADGRPMRTIYKHLHSVAVKPGDRLRRGQRIGGLGRTGLLSANILHLHFEVRQKADNGRYQAVDPGLYWAGGRGRIVCFNDRKYWPERPFRLTYPVICRGA